MGICPGGGGGYGAFGYCDGDTYPDGSYDHTVMIFGGWQASRVCPPDPGNPAIPLAWTPGSTVRVPQMSILAVMRRREISVNGRASAAIAALPACAALAIGGVLFGCGSANADTYYANCAAAWADHAAPLHQGDAGYRAVSTAMVTVSPARNLPARSSRPLGRWELS